MAFTKEKIFYGITLPSAYYKIKHFSVVEDGSDAGGKFYKIFAQIDTFTDETKENSIEQVTKELPGFREAEINFDNIYIKVMELEEFVGSVAV